MARIVLVHWNEEEATARAEKLMASGHDVVAAWKDGGDAYRLIRESAPDAVVMSLDRAPSRGRDLARSVLGTRWGRDVRFVFVTSDHRNLDALRDRFPDAVYVGWSEIEAALA